jgi:hypothetical protein
MSGPGALPPEMEMANLEHELAVLRERYSTALREAGRIRRISKYGVSVILAALGGAVIYFGSRSSDALPILFVVTGLVVVIVLVTWLCTRFDDGKPGSRLYDERYPFLTDEEFLNHAIAIREQRLRELRAAS